ASRTRNTESSNTSAPNDGTPASSVSSWAMISLCTSRMSGHHVEGDQVAVVFGDTVDVPFLAGVHEGAFAVKRSQQCLANCEGHRPVEHAADHVEPLDVALQNHLNT